MLQLQTNVCDLKLLSSLGYREASSHPGVSFASCVCQHGSPHPVPRQSEPSDPKGTFLRDAEEEESTCSQACIQVNVTGPAAARRLILT